MPETYTIRISINTKEKGLKYKHEFLLDTDKLICEKYFAYPTRNFTQLADFMVAPYSKDIDIMMYDIQQMYMRYTIHGQIVYERTFTKK